MLLNFFKKPKTTHIPSTVSNPEPIHSNTFTPEKITNTAAVTMTNVQCEGAVSPSKPEAKPASSISSTTYQKLSLKAQIMMLVIFSARPSDFDDTSILSGELWEEVVNKILKLAFGWGVEGNMDSIIRRGRKGLDGLADFVKYFIVKQGVNEALFEGKLFVSNDSS